MELFFDIGVGHHKCRMPIVWIMAIDPGQGLPSSVIVRDHGKQCTEGLIELVYFAQHCSHARLVCSYIPNWVFKPKTKLR